jgi:glycosyltransferase involved in cell wall biosynthesis
MAVVRRLSIVVPAYNAAATIAETVASARNAADALSGVDCEIVVVDDGSADATVEVVRDASAGDDRVHVHRHRRNRGGAAARNTAVEAATGDWLFCLDADNLLDASSLVAIVELAGTGAFDIVAPAETRYFRTSREQPTHSWLWERDTLDIADVLRMYETPVASGNYLYSLDAWARAGGYPEFAGSLDAWGFGVRALFEGARFGVCPATFYLHRQGHDSYYMRDTDGRRAIAAAQILLPYVERLTAADRAWLLHDGGLLEYFAEIPNRPLHVEGATVRDAAVRVVVGSTPGSDPNSGENDGRAVSAARRAWTEAPPQATVRRLRRALRLESGKP